MSITPHQLATLHSNVEKLYQNSDDLPFHGWPHIHFVFTKTALFAESLGADILLSQACALVHDLNYLAVKREWSHPEAGQNMRQHILAKCGFSPETIRHMEEIILSEETSIRDENISLEAKALADADTLFKALPTTPILFASRFINQTGYNIQKLANKVIEEQMPLLEKGIYFYSNEAKKHLNWAHINLELWKNVQTALQDKTIQETLQKAGFSI